MRQRLIPILLLVMFAFSGTTRVSPIRAQSDGVVTNLLNEGPGSLRAAVEAEVQDITFSTGLNGTIQLESSLSVERGDFYLLRPGVDHITIAGNNTFPLFTHEIDSQVSFHDLTFADGGGLMGGAMRMVEDCDACKITLNNTTFVNNMAGQGGAIYAASGGDVEIANTTFEGNTATEGGAIYFRGDGNMTVESSTFANNTATQGGAIDVGVLDAESIANIEIENSTFYQNGNGSTEKGGAINMGADSAVTLTGSTFYGNRAEDGGTVYARQGALKLIGSIFQVNAGVSNCDVEDMSLYYGWDSLEYPTEECADTTTVDPHIQSALSNNGGSTLTLAPLPGSPAIDTALLCEDGYDQTGLTFPLDGNADGAPICDIGAVEFGGQPLVIARFKPVEGEPPGGNFTVAPGTPVVLEIEINNGGSPDPLTNIELSAFLPDKLRFVNDGEASTTCLEDPNEVEIDIVNRRIRLADGTANAFIDCHVMVRVTSDHTGSYLFENVVSQLSIPFAVQAEMRFGLYECSEAGYVLATANGGTAVFECESDTVIQLDGQQGILLPGNTRLDGWGRARFQPGRGTSVFRAGPGGPLNLNGITIFNSGDTAPSSTIYVQTGVTMRINRSEFRNYAALVDSNGLGGSGGVLYIRRGGTAIITNSTFADNSAARDGGVIYVENGGTLWLANSSLGENSAGHRGGAIYAESGANVTLIHVSMAGNEAGLGGGAIYAEQVAVVTVGNSILAHNQVDGVDNNCTGTLTPFAGDSDYAGGNLEYPGDSCVGAAGADEEVDPLLVMYPTNRYLPVLDGAVAKGAGSPTYVIELESTSPARDEGILDLCASSAMIGGETSTIYLINGLDQHGWRRMDGCDIGASELNIGLQPSYDARPRLALSLTPSTNHEVEKTIIAHILPYFDLDHDGEYDVGEPQAYGYNGSVELGIVVNAQFERLTGVPPLTFRAGVQSCDAALPDCQARQSMALRFEETGSYTLVARDTRDISPPPLSAVANLTVQEAPRVYNYFSPPVIGINEKSYLTYSFENHNDTSLTNVHFSDTLPIGAVLNGGTSPEVLYSPCAGVIVTASDNDSLSVSNITLKPNSTCTLQIGVRSDAAGFYEWNAASPALEVFSTGLEKRVGRLNFASLEVQDDVPPPVSPTCAGDADESSAVTIADFSILASAFGKRDGQPNFDGRADFNADGSVTVTDLSMLAANFGREECD